MSSRTRSQPAQRLSRRQSAAGADPRLGSDKIRQALLTAIFKEADAAPVGRCEGFAFPKLEAPAPPSIAVGDAIDLADGIRIFEQYAKVVSDACRAPEPGLKSFLSGTLLPPQLEWFEPLRAPVRSNPALEATFQRMLRLFRAGRPGAPAIATASAELYALQQSLRHVDIELVRHLLKTGRPSAPEYEAHISAHLCRARPSLSWLEHQEALDAWRDGGLLHPLLIAATHMPTLNDWLPVELHEAARGWGETLTSLNAARSGDEVHAALDGLGSCVDWEAPAGLAIAGLLDHLAVAMRVLSNAPAPNNNLDAALARFPDWSGAPGAGPSIGRVWKEARAVLEHLIPPSLLCPRLAGFKRATWGYQALTPVVDGEAVRFAERSLAWVEPSPERPPPLGAEPGRKHGHARLQDVLCRMGVVALSPEVGHLMMLAIEALDHLESGASRIAPHEQQYCQSPATLLHFMSNTTLASDDDDIQRVADSLFRSLPAVIRVARPVRLAGWRVDPPSRIVLYTGPVPGRALTTALLDERSDAQQVGGILALPPAAPDDTRLDPAFRARLADAMLAHLRGPLREPLVETVRLDGNRPHTHTALHEGLAEMALREPALHTFIHLHQSNRWENDREDVRCAPRFDPRRARAPLTSPPARRYSESQLGANGQRFRDWYAVHQDPAGPQKCRLDSHAVRADHYYATLFPWRRDDGTTEWVNVASSVEPQVRVLQGRRLASAGPPDRASALLSSVKARFMQDLKLLPVRDPVHRIERANTSVYADRERGQVLICYAPTGDPEARLEFLAFGLRT